MRSKFKVILFVFLFGIAGLLFAGLIILFLKYFPLGEKRNYDLFLIVLAILSIFYIVKSVIKFFRKKE